MQLYYHRCPQPNFGDELNLWFWERVFGFEFDGDTQSLFLGIGTILNSKLPSASQYTVVGSGVGYGELPALDGSWKVYALRGPLSAERLGLSPKLAITDPAMMMPQLYQPDARGTEGLAFMPHVGIDSPAYQALVERLGLRYISPTLPPLEAIAAIARSDRLITSAMHGAIIADAYRVPWHPVVTSNEILPFKWNDWTQSIGIGYQPTALPALWHFTKESVLQRTKRHIKEYLLSRRLKAIASKGNFTLSRNEVLSDRVDQLGEMFRRVGEELR